MFHTCWVVKSVRNSWKFRVESLESFWISDFLRKPRKFSDRGQKRGFQKPRKFLANLESFELESFLTSLYLEKSYSRRYRALITVWVAIKHAERGVQGVKSKNFTLESCFTASKVEILKMIRKSFFLVTQNCEQPAVNLDVEKTWDKSNVNRRPSCKVSRFYPPESQRKLFLANLSAKSWVLCGPRDVSEKVWLW